jgi:hypothetical protein
MSYPAVWLLALLVSAGNAGVKENEHIRWHFSSLAQSGSEWKLLFAADVDRGWHLYSQFTPEGGPLPTSFEFDGEGYKLLRRTIEAGDLKKAYDSTFMVNVKWYEGEVIFSQRVKVRSKTKVSGVIRYSVCSGEVCIPGAVRFSLDVGN